MHKNWVKLAGTLNHSERAHKLASSEHKGGGGKRAELKNQSRVNIKRRRTSYLSVWSMITAMLYSMADIAGGKSKYTQ